MGNPQDYQDEKESQTEGYVIPAKIHFIWIGGPMPEKYVDTLLQMAILAEKSGFEINLWVDNETNLTRSKFFQNKDLDQTRIPFLRLRNINEISENILNNMQNDSFYTPEKFHQFVTCVDRERVGLKNLAAASDILRYEILRQEGGYYFDTDTEFEFKVDADFLENNDKPLQPDSTKHGILINLTHNKIANDIIASIPHHPVMEMCLDKIFKNYEKLDRSSNWPVFDSEETEEKKYNTTMMDKKRSPLKENFRRALIGTPASENRMDLTVEMSGPSLLLQCARSYCSLNNIRENSLAFEYSANQNTEVCGIHARTHSDITWAPTGKKHDRFFDNSQQFSSISNGNNDIEIKPESPSKIKKN